MDESNNALTEFTLFVEHYQAHCLQGSELYDGVDATLRQLTSLGTELAVLTNKPLAPSEAILAGRGIRELFRQVIGGDSPRHPRKPATFKSSPGRRPPIANFILWLIGKRTKRYPERVYTSVVPANTNVKLSERCQSESGAASSNQASTARFPEKETNNA